MLLEPKGSGHQAHANSTDRAWERGAVCVGGDRRGRGGVLGGQEVELLTIALLRPLNCRVLLHEAEQLDGPRGVTFAGVGRRDATGRSTQAYCRGKEKNRLLDETSLLICSSSVSIISNQMLRQHFPTRIICVQSKLHSALLCHPLSKLFPDISRIHTLPEMHMVLKTFLQATGKTMVYDIASDWELCEIMRK